MVSVRSQHHSTGKFLLPLIKREDLTGADFQRGGNMEDIRSAAAQRPRELENKHPGTSDYATFEINNKPCPRADVVSEGSMRSVHLLPCQLFSEHAQFQRIHEFKLSEGTENQLATRSGQLAGCNL